MEGAPVAGPVGAGVAGGAVAADPFAKRSVGTVRG